MSQPAAEPFARNREGYSPRKRRPFCGDPGTAPAVEGAAPGFEPLRKHVHPAATPSVTALRAVPAPSEREPRNGPRTSRHRLCGPRDDSVGDRTVPPLRFSNRKRWLTYIFPLIYRFFETFCNQKQFTLRFSSAKIYTIKDFYLLSVLINFIRRRNSTHGKTNANNGW